MSFLSQDEKDECSSMLDEVFNTFKETIVIYKTPTETFISSDTDYNFFYQNGKSNADVTYTVQTGIFQGTIRYINQESNQQIKRGNTDIPMRSEKGLVQVSLESGARPFITKDIEKFVFDGNHFKIASPPVFRGIFNRNYFDFYLEAIDPLR